MIPALARAAAAVRAKFGADSSLAGTPIGPVAIQYGVDDAFLMSDGLGLPRAEMRDGVRHDVATLPASAAPKVGQTLVHPDGTFKLDQRIGENGHNVQFTVRKVS